MEWVERVSKIPVNGVKEEPQLGGTIGDIEGMPFVEAFRQFQFRVKPENFCNIHVSLVPQPSATGEQKIKPTQHSWQLWFSPNRRLTSETGINCQSRFRRRSTASKVGMMVHIAKREK
ncbi:unnamed protein product [Clavelina lepadiformis]|uniref:CTP synthase N-terminal domain-containing protein n=1 Tax=Clavelina lepadiformis TaxID=159417 RepID=A0ABP0EVM2_CLALP